MPLLRPPRLRGHILVFLVAATLIGTAAAFTIVLAHRRAFTIWTGRLQSGAADRARLIELWIMERRSDATIVASLPAARAIAATPRGRVRPLDPTLAAVVTRHLRQGIAAVVVGSPSEVVWMQPRLPVRLPTAFDSLVGLAARSDTARIDLFDNHRGGDLIAVTAPIADAAGRRLGAVALLSWPDSTLYPLVTTEPVPTRSGETVLYTRDGDRLLGFSPRRFRAAGTPDAPVAVDTLDPVRRRVLLRQVPFGSYRDYRGESVLAAAVAVRGTDWGVLRKVDRAEVFADYRHDALLATVLAVLAVALCGSALAGHRIWQRRRDLERDLELVRRSGDLAALFEASRVFMHEERLPAVLSGACRFAVEHFGLRMAWIGLVERGTPEIRPAAQWGAEDGYLEAVRITRDETATGAGPTGLALRSRQPAVVNRIATDPSFSPWRAAALARGYRASAALPLLVEGEAIGTLNAYAGEPDAFHDERVRLLEAFTNVVATAVRRARLQTEVAEREERLRLAVDIGQLEVWTSDPASGEVNAPDFDRVFDLPVGTYGPEAFWQLVHPDDRQRVADAHRVGLPAGRTVELEFRLVAPDGGVRWAVSRARQSRKADGSPGLIIGVTQNVTAAKRAEVALRESEQRLRLALDAGQIATWELDLGTRRVTRSANYPHVFDFPPGVLGDTFAEFRALVHPEDRDRMEAEVNNSIALDLPLDIEFRLRPPDGRVRWLSSRARLLSEEGRADRLVGVAANITVRKEAEEARARLLQRQRLILGGMPVGCVITDAEFRIQYWNPAAERLFGFSEAEVLGRSPLDVNVAPAARFEVEAIMARAHRDGLPAQVTHENVTKDGRVIVCEWHNTPLVDADGTRHGLLAMVLDVTERIRAEGEIRSSALQLRRLARRLQTVRDDEQARIARDLHDRLGQALTMLKLDLTRTFKEAPSKNAAQRRRAATLVAQVDGIIQAVRQISADLRPPILEDLGLAPALEWSAQQFTERTGVPCGLDLSTAEVPREAARALYAIAQEALTNVARHAGATATTLRLTAADGLLVLEVADNGRGFDAKAAASSLGLAGMRERAVALGGEFVVRSTRDHGSTITVRVPLTRAES